MTLDTSSDGRRYGRRHLTETQVREDLAEVAAQARLEELRARLDAEDISYRELAELQGLAEHIQPGDVQLLEAAGVPEEHAYLSGEARTLLVVTAEAVRLGILTQEHRETLDDWIIER